MPSTATNPTVRLFIGLLPSSHTRQQLKRFADAWQWAPGAVRTRPERLHLTLHFLGDVPAFKLPALKRGLQVPFAPFELCFGAPAVWNQGVAVIEPAFIPQALVDLHDALAAALAREGVQSVRHGFTPHITLARKAGGSVPPAQPLAVRRRVSEYVLIRSELAPPATYHVEQSYSLA
ncbi:MAG: RNA 2',3'-cyclic phosphodiesterase [Burkholderiaceae bacterium]